MAITKVLYVFLKSSNYWVANKLTVTKVSYVFLEIDKLSGGQKLTITKVSYVFPLNRRVIGWPITKFAMFFEIVKK